VLDIVCPADSKSKDILRHRELVGDLWACFADLVETLTFMWPDDIYATQSMNDELAGKLKKVGVEFVNLYRAFQPSRKALYMHYVAKHIPEQVQDKGPLGPFSGTSIEAGHKKVCLFV
jgi:hypothetical protein